MNNGGKWGGNGDFHLVSMGALAHCPKGTDVFFSIKPFNVENLYRILKIVKNVNVWDGFLSIDWFY